MRLKGPVDSATEPAAQPTAATAWSSKLQLRHFERRAVVYVRQSAARQVFNHRESAARRASFVSGHKGQRRSTAVFGRGKSIQPR